MEKLKSEEKNTGSVRPWRRLFCLQSHVWDRSAWLLY